MKRHVSNRRGSAGFSLVELMVAVAISLLLLLGVVSIFSSSRVAYESTDQLSRIQETGRFALDEFSRRVRMAGFGGCSREPNFMSSALANSSVLQWNFLKGAVEGFDGNTPSESDTLAIRGPRMDFEPVQVTADMTDPQLPLAVSNTNAFSAGDVVVAYSCEGRAFFQVTGAGGGTLAHAVQGSTPTTPGNAFASTNYPFRTGAEVMPVETALYYIADAQVTPPPASPPPPGTKSLWRRIGLGAPQELVQGVDQMQIEYGEDRTGDRAADQYNKATDVVNWDRVVSVRIALLVRSVEQYGTDPDRNTYQLLSEATGITVPAAGDRRLRQVFTATISMRNRTRIE
jgi:type IV pilus assembly protein PilW